MESFKKVTSIVTPLDKVNVDTDQIVPKQFLKLVQKSGFGNSCSLTGGMTNRRTRNLISS